jgi:hypothetical protein
MKTSSNNSGLAYELVSTDDDNVSQFDRFLKKL